MVINGKGLLLQANQFHILQNDIDINTCIYV
jgi:hypothetical protein